MTTHADLQTTTDFIAVMIYFKYTHEVIMIINNLTNLNILQLSF
jgi:hypothetical protein